MSLSFKVPAQDACSSPATSFGQPAVQRKHVYMWSEYEPQLLRETVWGEGMRVGGRLLWSSKVTHLLLLTSISTPDRGVM